MAYLLPTCLILHVPKTGSNWVRAACQASVRERRQIAEIGEWHCDLQTAGQLLTEQDRPMPFVGTFVRHPLEWYASAWCFWMEKRRFPRELDEPKVECNDFEQFIRNCMEVEPGGYVSTLYERFTGTEPGAVSFIGRQETLENDLIRLLRLAGEDFDERALRETPLRNIQASRDENVFPGYSYELARTVIRYERRAMERFGYAV